MRIKTQGPTPAEVRKFLRGEIATWQKSYTNLVGSSKGKITHPAAQKAIACLRAALVYIK